MAVIGAAKEIAVKTLFTVDGRAGYLADKVSRKDRRVEITDKEHIIHQAHSFSRDHYKIN